MDSVFFQYTSIDFDFIRALESSVNGLADISFVDGHELELSTFFPPLVNRYATYMEGLASEVTLFTDTIGNLHIKQDNNNWVMREGCPVVFGQEKIMPHVSNAPPSVSLGLGTVELTMPSIIPPPTAIQMFPLDAVAETEFRQQFSEAIALAHSSQQLMCVPYHSLLNDQFVAVLAGPVKSQGSITVAFVLHGGLVQITSATEEIVIVYCLFNQLLTFWDPVTKNYYQYFVSTPKPTDFPARFEWVITELYDFLFTICQPFY